MRHIKLLDFEKIINRSHYSFTGTTIRELVINGSLTLINTEAEFGNQIRSNVLALGTLRILFFQFNSSFPTINTCDPYCTDPKDIKMR